MRISWPRRRTGSLEQAAPVSKTLTTDWQTMPPSSPAYEDFWWIIWPFGYVRQLPSSH